MINYNFPLIGGKLIERKISEWRAEGRAEERAAWSAWNSRRMEAERGGVPFREPPPDDGGSRVGLSEKERE